MSSPASLSFKDNKSSRSKNPIAFAAAISDETNEAARNAPHLTHWNHAKLLVSEHFRYIVTYDVQLAVVPHIEQTARPAFVSSECVVTLEGEKHSRPQTSHSYELLVRNVLASGTHSTE